MIAELIFGTAATAAVLLVIVSAPSVIRQHLDDIALRHLDVLTHLLVAEFNEAMTELGISIDGLVPSIDAGAEAFRNLGSTLVEQGTLIAQAVNDLANTHPESEQA